MTKKKKKELEEAGWSVGTAHDFLGLNREEAEFIELKLALAEGLRHRRDAKKVTQAELAKLVQSSQSRVAKMEACDPTVSIDLLVRSLFASGATRVDVARMIARPKKRRRAA